MTEETCLAYILSWQCCLLWLRFVSPRSHPARIGPIGECNVSEFIHEQAYRYSTLFLPLDMCSSSRRWLAFYIPYRFLYVLTEFCIPQVPSLLNWANCRVLSPLPIAQDMCWIWRKRLALRMPFPSSWIGTWFSYVWLGFVYIPGPIQAELGQLENLAELRLNSNNLSGTQSLFPLTCIQYEGIGLLSLCPFVPVG